MFDLNSMSMSNNVEGNKNTQFSSIHLPLLGPKSFREVIAYIQKAIIDEATTAHFYKKLLKEAKDELQHDFIEHAYKDELEHLHFFECLYYQYMNKKATYSINSIHYTSYKEGILIALKGELDAVEFYRNVQLSVSDQLIRDTFYFAMVDEQEHATQFSMIYTML